MAELFVNAVVIVLLAGLCLLTFGIGGRQVSSDHFGPQGFPRLLIALALVLLVAVSARALGALRSASRRLPRWEAGLVRTPLFLCLLALVVYVAALNVAGYILSTLLFVLLVGRAMGYARHLRLGFYSLTVTAVLVVLFGRLFAVPLPRGVGWLRELSYLIY